MLSMNSTAYTALAQSADESGFIIAAMSLTPTSAKAAAEARYGAHEILVAKVTLLNERGQTIVTRAVVTGDQRNGFTVEFKN